MSPVALPIVLEKVAFTVSDTGVIQSPDLSNNPEAHMSAHEAAVVQHYDERHTFWEKITHSGDLHCGLFEVGDTPADLSPQNFPTWSVVLAARDRMSDAVTAPAAIGAGDQVVDAGCGFGAVALYLARQHGCTVTGVNINHRQLEVARQQAAEEGLADRVIFHYADCSQRLPFADASVDVVVNMESACHYSNRLQFLLEVSRILKPGGRFVTEDFMTSDDLTAQEYQQHIEPFCRAWAIHSLESQASYTDKLETAGLELLEFVGFNGADEFNLRVLEYRHKRTARVLFSHGVHPDLRKWHAMWGTHALGWRGGHMSLKRFLARKPMG